jgi:transketolase
MNVPFKKVAVNDTFAETGSAEQLYEKYGLSANHIVEAIKTTAAKKG